MSVELRGYDLLIRGLILLDVMGQLRYTEQSILDSCMGSLGLCLIIQLIDGIEHWQAGSL